MVSECTLTHTRTYSNLTDCRNNINNTINSDKSNTSNKNNSRSNKYNDGVIVGEQRNTDS